MHYDSIVIGLGGMGSATAYQLAARGQKVLGLEQHTPAHAHGSSHGHSRIIRHAYSDEHPSYVPLLRRAFTLWHELKDNSDEDLLHVTGGIIMGHKTNVQGTLASVREHNLSHEMLDAAAIRARYPALTPTDDVIGIAERDAGYVVPEAAIRTHLRLATAHGATLQFGETVQQWHALPGGGVQVTTNQARYTADHLVITAGAWAPQLLAEMGLPLRVERHVMLWFDPIGGYTPFQEPNLPVYIWDCGNEGAFYGFPAQTGFNGVKVAIHTDGDVCTPTTIDRTLRESDVSAMQKLLDKRIPGLCGRPLVNYATCMYTITPDTHFIITIHPEHPQVVIASPCSGHGFKFTPVIGEILADLTITGRTAHDISLFALRF